MAQRKPIVHTADVIRHGEKIIVPEAITLPAAVEILQKKILEEDQVVRVSENIIAFPWEGALAFKKALDEMFGSSAMVAERGMFGDRPPQMIALQTGPDSKVMVPWGKFPFPLDPTSYLVTSWNTHEGRVVFAISGEVKRKWLPTISRLADLTREFIQRESIYRGKAVRINFEDGDVPQPQFVDLRGVATDEMVYTKELTALIDANILTPLRHPDECRRAGIPLKRGVLLAGPYGTGKSLLARAVAKVGTMNGWTFIYIKDASQLPEAIKFAQLYQPAVIFAEDVDRHVTGERTEGMDQILNTLDGIDTKTAELMVVLTTNHLDQINRAMLRPGRLDVILNITAPDAEAVQRLIAMYSRGKLDPSADLTESGALLAGYTPAIIREVVERAKLTCISRTGSADSALTGEDIALSARTMVQQQELLKTPEPAKTEWHNGLVEAIAGASAVSTKDTLKSNGLGTLIKQVEEIHKHTV